MSRKILSDLDFVSAARIRNLPAPAASDEPVRLTELNTAIEGLKNKDPVVVSTQSNVNLAAPGASIDGITMASGDRFLARSQTTASQNGIYIWNGASSAATRSIDANSATELNNAIVSVTGGSDVGKTFRQTATIVTLGTDTVTWTSFGTGASAASETTAGIAEIATQAETDTGTDDARIVTPLKQATWSGRKRKHIANFGDGAATQYDFTHNFGMREVVVNVFRNSTPWDNVECEISRPDANTVRLNLNVAPTSNQYTVVIIG